MHQVAQRHVRQWQPADKMRIGLERQNIVIEETGPQGAGEDDRVAGSCKGQSAIVAPDQGLDVVPVGVCQGRLIGESLYGHVAIITPGRAGGEPGTGHPGPPFFAVVLASCHVSRDDGGDMNDCKNAAGDAADG